jgi:DNA-binding NtrC family response regulator
MPKPSILLLDDDAEVVAALGKFLRKRGYDVTTTAWPADAVEILGKADRSFDVVITDIRMPAISGFTLMRALREAHPGMAVIVISAFANSVICEAALDDGAIACLAKPVDTDLLLEVLSRTTSVVRQQTVDA